MNTATFVTTIDVTYRDADNYKLHGTLTVAGPLTATHIATLRELLDDDLYFTPIDVGLEHLIDTDSTWTASDSDHCWHELDLDPTTFSTKPAHTGLNIDYPDADTLIAAFTTAHNAGWPNQTDQRWT